MTKLPKVSSLTIIALTFLGSIRACKKAALECDEAKFEQYKVASGDRITPEIIQSVQCCFEKIRGLES
jgi:ribonuclease P/MRP protein subunit POP5